jgi:putative ABC transport system permease protein
MIGAKDLLKLAARNVRRNRVRTILTVAASAAGIMVFLMSSSILGGIDETSIRNLVNSDTAHIKIYNRSYYPDRKDMYLENLINDYNGLIVKIKSIDSGIAITPRLKFTGAVSMPEEDAPCTVIGLDPETDGLVFNVLKSIITPGKGEDFYENAHACLMGVKFADYIGVKPGDEILLSGRTLHGTYNADSYTIAGLVSCDNPAIDAFSVILPLPAALKFADTGGGVSEIDLAAGSRDSPLIEKIIKRLGEWDFLPADLKGYSWKDELSDMITVFGIRRAAQKLIIGLLSIIAVAGIANTMLMAVFERTKEIGTMAAMGMKKREIALLFLFEGTIIGIIGSLAAIIITAIPLTLLSRVGIVVKGSELLANVPISSRIYGYIEMSHYLTALIIAFITSVIASVYPALKAAGLNISMVLRSR